MDNDVSVIDATALQRANHHADAGIPTGRDILAAGGLAVDAAAHTTYVTTGIQHRVDDQHAHLQRRPAMPDAPTRRQPSPSATIPAAIAIDRRTHTVYVANAGSGATGTVSVLDAQTCNATHSAGCAERRDAPSPRRKPRRHRRRHRNRHDLRRDDHRQRPGPRLGVQRRHLQRHQHRRLWPDAGDVAVGDSGDRSRNSSLNLAVNQATNTIYASNIFNTDEFSPPPFLGNSVYVINGATCDAANTTGCGQTPATVTLASNPPVGSNPLGIAVDQATDTIYTANIADGEHPGTVSVINGATCNGQDTSGCGQTPATAPAGFGANGIAIDHTTHRVYVTNIEDTSVSVIDGAACNGQRHQRMQPHTAQDRGGRLPRIDRGRPEGWNGIRGNPRRRLGHPAHPCQVTPTLAP